MKVPFQLLQRALAPSPEKLVAIGGLLIVATLYLDISPNNPPHFYRDESAIAYNAYTLETTGKDEYGARFPLFIRSFGDYKSPVYVYMLAGVFRVTGPSIRVARDFSAVIGLATIFVLYALAYLITRRVSLALATALLAGLSPYLFEISRLVFEVALEPVLIALFLLVLWRAGRGRWRRRESIALAFLLALQTYDYQAGRVFAPAFFLGVLLFYRRAGVRRLIELTVAFGIFLIPLIVYTRVHPGTLQHRLATVTWYRSRMSTGTVVWQFLRHYLDDLNPWTWGVTGDVESRDHVPGDGSLFFTEIGLAIMGAAIALFRRDPFWRFVVFSLFVSPIAAATTFGGIQTLREITIAVLLPLLAIPAMQAIVRIPRPRLRVATVGALAIALAVETFHWQVVFRHNGPKRVFDFEAPIQPVIDAAFKRGGTVYAYRTNHATYIDSLWFGVLDKRAPSSIVVLNTDAPPPPGSLVIGATNECAQCKPIITDGEFQAYITPR